MGPGSYFIATVGLVVTLETWVAWTDLGQSITVKDITGSDTPNITVNAPTNGTIDGLTSINMPNSNQALSFVPVVNPAVQNGFAWAIK